MPAWEKVEIPQSSGFIGWGVREGQHVTGKVVDYDPTGGRDFGGKACPQIEVELTEKASSFNKRLERTFHEVGERVTVTCGLYELKAGIEAADPAVGDLIKMVLDGTEELDNGNTVKRFSLQIARGKGKAGRPNVKVVKDIPSSDDAAEPAAAPDDDDIPF